MVEYLGYKVYENGEVFNKADVKMHKTPSHSGTKVFNILINGKYINMPCQRFIYQAFHQDEDLTNYLIKTKVKNDHSINNLYKIRRNELKITDFKNFKSKIEILNRAVEHKENGRDDLYRELLWVLGDFNNRIDL